MSTLASCCRDPIHITCVLSAFILSLLLLIHDSIFFVQLTNRRTAVRAFEAPVLRWTCVSSAYKWAFMSSFLMISSNSAMYRRNRSGPSTEHTSEPSCPSWWYSAIWKDSRDPSTEQLSRNITCCIRFRRKDLIQLSADPVMPNVRSSRANRISWSTQSNAALRSSKPSSVTSWLSIELRRSEVTRSNAVLVEWGFRYADCSTGIKLIPCRKPSGRSDSNRSTTLETKVWLETGM